MKPQTVQQVPVDQLQCGPQIRERFDEKSLQEMAKTFDAVGILQPLLVRREGTSLFVVEGERRLRAAKLAGRPTVPVIVLDGDLSETDRTLRMLIANVHRKDLTAVEKARGLDRLIKATGGSATEVASQTGLSIATVSRHLALLDLPAPLLAKVESGAISPSAGYALSQVSDPAEQADLASKLEQGQLNRDGVAGAIKSRKAGASSRPADAGTSRATAMLGSGRRITVHSANLSLETFIECLDELLAKARKVRPQGLELNTFLKMLQDQAKA